MGITKNHVFGSEFCPKFKYSDVKCHGFESSIQDCSYRIEHADCADIEQAGGIVCQTNEYGKSRFPNNRYIQLIPYIDRNCNLFRSAASNVRFHFIAFKV